MSKLLYRNYLLGMLLLISTVSLFERFVFALMLEPIKADLELSDSQIGLMTGLAFSAFYAVAGIPIARWADRGNRVTIAASAVGLLGVMLSMCGMAVSFFQLLLFRAGVAVGEAGTTPTAQTLLADYYDRAQRPRAMAILIMSYPLSMIVGYLVGGWLVEAYGWRYTFIVMGIPGLAIAILAKLTLKEPRLKKKSITTVVHPPMNEVIKTLWKQRSLRHIFSAFCVSYFFSMASSQWLAPFFMRSHGMGSAELGFWLAVSWGIMGLLGNYLGGHITARYLAGKEKIQFRVIAITMVIYSVLLLLVYLVPDKNLALFFLAISAFVVSLANGPQFAAVQSLVNDRMRAMTIVLLFFFANLVGFGFGPVVLGVISDLLTPLYGQDALRYALAAFCPGLLWVAVHDWKAGRTIEGDIKRVELQADSAEPQSLQEKASTNDDGGLVSQGVIVGRLDDAG